MAKARFEARYKRKMDEMEARGQHDMPVDMKKHIAETAVQLLYDENIKKLTVKDIVEACNITRQAFYYHFEDIPDLIRWSLQNEFQNIAKQSRGEEDIETVISRFLRTALEKRPYAQKIMSSNYGETVERLMMENMREYLMWSADEKQLFPDCGRAELKLTVNYYVYALKGIIQEWDSLNIDEDRAAHQIYRLFVGEVHL